MSFFGGEREKMKFRSARTIHWRANHIYIVVLIYYPPRQGYHREPFNQINPFTITDNCSLASFYELYYLF